MISKVGENFPENNLSLPRDISVKFCSAISFIDFWIVFAITGSAQTHLLCSFLQRQPTFCPEAELLLCDLLPWEGVLGARAVSRYSSTSRSGWTSPSSPLRGPVRTPHPAKRNVLNITSYISGYISILFGLLCGSNIISDPLLQLLGCHSRIIPDNFIKDFHLSCHVPISRWCPSLSAGFVGVGRMIVRKVGRTGFHSWETFHAGDDDNNDIW